nr:PREDICTED: pancreatic secretory granule membrane major glycoprotein GP2 [Rhinolophus sinicus]XP_019607197.1 PREDICTED: pancreatic secretory granule membrane major glycoprotein GP2 [Rhinolophus sinicus]XP_019607198.1 PREDICTED: pancreatic secretory granule membrane major glycoprotein GP2 [Rhinolophus sinicus]XP_019607199.1 PREDICTED: pancreatic secretory granule membrane major glycoprotein GP2 [Rhinolophus sinicus]XP_019607200.1 PREDICTED: pancreatic secretory granule membrane major glycoprot
MAGSHVLWLAVASCLLTLASTEPEGHRNPSHASSYGLDLECGAPGAPEPPLCFDPCQNYTRLDDPSRSSENTDRGHQCDTDLRGWFRFVGEGGVRMPDTCVPGYRCHTDAPMWLNGTHPVLGGGTVTRNACAYWSGNCCYWKTEVRVKACPGGYHVYWLNGSPSCNLRYCTDPSTVEDRCEKTCRPEEECSFLNGTWSCVCRQNVNGSDIHNLQPQLDCGDREITVSLDRCQLAGLGFGDEVIAYLRDWNCSTFLQREEQNRVSVSSPAQAHACGNVLERNRTHAIYKNTLSLVNDFIIRDTKLSINFQCAYPLDMKVSLETALQPIVSSLNISLGGEGEFTIRMALFQDQNYTLPYEGAMAVLSVESMLYVGAILERGDTSRFNLLLRNCYATPTSDKTDPVKYFIIRNSCPNKRDSTISVEENGVSPQGRFSVQMFMFAGNYDLVFLHCEVHLCDSVNEQCQPSCSRSQVRSEAAEIDPALVLDLGPIARRGAPSAGIVNGTPSTAGFLMAWPMLLLPVLLAELF